MDCSEAAMSKTIFGHPLTETLPGLFSTVEIEDENIALPIFGGTIYARSTYSIETDTIAIIDENTIISSPRNVDNCTLSAGTCTIDDAVNAVVWKPTSEPPSAVFKQYILLKR
ncbi:unnamed protein product [Heligmosomoides polygyrus]|uniref:Uncharacterized protein n=1 Tax=Heligmosomoides polygyrus TaxID=6339 RepID=A0A183G238_HELPZ|nr:unnamed protein product [Heligmosomoides polygyrus]